LERLTLNGGSGPALHKFISFSIIGDVVTSSAYPNIILLYMVGDGFVDADTSEWYFFFVNETNLNLLRYNYNWTGTGDNSLPSTIGSPVKLYQLDFTSITSDLGYTAPFQAKLMDTSVGKKIFFSYINSSMVTFNETAPCLNDSDCSCSLQCNGQYCIPIPVSGSRCPNGTYCSLTLQTCIECNNDTFCRNATNCNAFCSNGFCTNNNSIVDCVSIGTTCDTTIGSCIDTSGTSGNTSTGSITSTGSTQTNPTQTTQPSTEGTTSTESTDGGTTSTGSTQANPTQTTQPSTERTTSTESTKGTKSNSTQTNTNHVLTETAPQPSWVLPVAFPSFFIIFIFL